MTLAVDRALKLKHKQNIFHVRFYINATQQSFRQGQYLNLQT